MAQENKEYSSWYDKLQSGDQGAAKDFDSWYTGLEEGFPQTGQTPQERRVTEDFKLKAAGVPLDTQSGAPAWLRMKASVADNINEKLMIIAQDPNVENVFLRDNQIIMRTLDDEGNPKDVKFDERKLTFRDFMDVVGAIPEVGAAVLGAAVTKNAGPMTQMLASNLAAGSTVAGRDLMSQQLEGQGIDPGRAMAEGTTEAMIGGAFDTAIGMGAKGTESALNFGRSPNFDPARKQELINSAKRLSQRLPGNQQIQNTPGQLLDSDTMYQFENFMENVTGNNALKQARRTRENLMQSVVEDFPGKPKVSQLPAGNQVRQSMKERANVLSANLDQKNDRINRLIVDDLTSRIDRMTGAKGPYWGTGNEVREVYTDKIGQKVYSRMAETKQSADKTSQKLYEQATEELDALKGKGISINLNALTADLNDVLSTFPKDQRGKFIDTFLPNRTATNIEGVNRAALIFDAEGNRIDPQSATEAVAMSLTDAIQVQRMLNEDINWSQIGGIDNGLVKKARREIDRYVKGALNDPKAKKAKAAIEKANEDFIENVLPFRMPGVREAFASEADPSRLTNSQIVKSLTAAPQGKQLDLFKRYKKVLGEGSNEYKLLKKAYLRDQLKFNAGDPDMLDGGATLRALAKMPTDLKEELFGVHGRAMIQGLERQAKQAVYMKVGDFDYESLVKLVDANSPQQVKQIRRTIVQAQTINRALVNQYKKGVIGKLLKGEFDPDGIEPSQFVDLFLKEASNREVFQTMNYLRRNAPNVAESISSYAMIDFLQLASKITGPDATLASARRLIDPTKPSILIDPATANKLIQQNPRRYEALFTEDQRQVLSDMLIQLSADLKKSTIGKSGAELARGRLLSDPIATIPERIHFTIMAKMLSNPMLAKRAMRSSQKPLLSFSANTYAALFSLPDMTEFWVEQSREDPIIADFILNSEEYGIPLTDRSKQLLLGNQSQ